MNNRMSKSLYLLSKNSRITTKELSKQTRTSQQSASYLVNQLRKKRIIKDYNTIVDPIKLGFTNIIVGMNFISLDKEKKREVMSELKQTESIICIEEASQGVDLLIEFCASNLSAFNKTSSDIIDKFHSCIEVRFIHPVIVKHKYYKNYLVRKGEEKDIVLCGDRETRDFNQHEMDVLRALVKDPTMTFTKIAQKTKLSAKTIVNIKKRLEKQRIIRGYSCVLDNNKIGVRKQAILLRFGGARTDEMNKLTTYTKMHKNIIEITKLIGHYQLLIIAETTNNTNILKELRTEFHIRDYLLIQIEDTVKYGYIPENL